MTVYFQWSTDLNGAGSVSLEIEDLEPDQLSNRDRAWLVDLLTRLVRRSTGGAP